MDKNFRFVNRIDALLRFGREVGLIFMFVSDDKTIKISHAENL